MQLLTTCVLLKYPNRTILWGRLIIHCMYIYESHLFDYNYVHSNYTVKPVKSYLMEIRKHQKIRVPTYIHIMLSVYIDIRN